MLTKTQKDRLKKVCKVLFPKYKFMYIDPITSRVTMTNHKCRLVRWAFPSWKVSMTELINYQIPNQLADFKYGNKTFISIIQEELVRCELSKQDKIDYFLEEVTKVKCSDLYKQLKIDENPAYYEPISKEENDLYEELGRMIEYTEKEKKRYKSFWVSREAVFYTLLLIIMLFSVLIKIRL